MKHLRKMECYGAESMSLGDDHTTRTADAVKLDVLVRRIVDRCAQSPDVGATSLAPLTIDNLAC